MSLRDDVRWVCDAADGLLIGALPGRLPTWSTREGEKLAWLVLLLWRKYYDASMARITLEARVRRLEDDMDGLRETNRILTDMLEADTALTALRDLVEAVDLCYPEACTGTDELARANALLLRHKTEAARRGAP